MLYVVWNLEVQPISEAERDALLAQGLIYDADTDPEIDLPGAFYPEDGFDLADVRAAQRRLAAPALVGD